MDSKFALPGAALLAAAVLTLSCMRGGREGGVGEPAFVFGTSDMAGEEACYNRPAVITGHVSNRDVYPGTKEISIEVPFYDRVPSRQASVIYEDRFAFSLVPYAPRTISMPPYVDQMVVCPGDSVHVELDFSNLGKVAYSGRGAENNEKFNDFHTGYYPGDWPSFSRTETDAEGGTTRSYGNAGAFAQAARGRLESHLGRLEDFVSERRPSPELAALCRREIEADYYSALIQGLLTYKAAQGEDVSGLFKTEDAEPLFSGDCFSGNLFGLSSKIASWVLVSMDRREALRLADDYRSLVGVLRKSTGSDMLFQMMVAHFYNQFLEANDVERFEACFEGFNENVTHPLLKLSTRDRYVARKAYRLDPRSLSDAILGADKPRDGQTVEVPENEGLKLLRSVIAREERKVVYIGIGATWCPGTRQELPHQLRLAEKYRGKALRIVDFYLDDAPDDMDSAARGIEVHHLTDAQRSGLDPILHLGRGIPFYILIDKEGVVVDFGEHLRPSVPETAGRIDEYLGR